MNSEQISVDEDKYWPKGIHAILMFFVGPLLAFVVGGIKYGWPDLPSTVMPWVLAFASSFGTTVIALIIAWIVLIKGSRTTSWIILLILAGFFGTINAPLGVDRQKGKTTQKDPAPISSPTNRNDDEYVVNETIEELPPGMAATIDANTVQRFQEFYKDDFRKKLTLRFKGKGEPVPVYNATATTLHLQEQGHDIYMTELIVSDPASTSATNEAPKLLIFWNIQDNKIKRVQCTYFGETFVYRRGKCGEQIAKTFGWTGWHKP